MRIASTQRNHGLAHGWHLLSRYFLTNHEVEPGWIGLTLSFKVEVGAKKAHFAHWCTMPFPTTFGSAAMKPTDTALRRNAKTGSFASVREKGSKATEVHLLNLPTMTASQLKKGGWPGVMAEVNKAAAVAVTNHHRTEAVILTAGQYESLVQRASTPKGSGRPAPSDTASKEVALARLQSAFDQRLAKLKDGKSLGAATGKRARRGKVTLGPSV